MEKPTIFQRLNSTFGGGISNATSMSFNKNTRQYSSLGPNDVIFRTTDKEEYQQTLTRMRQQKMLSKQWKRAQYDTSINSLSNLSQVQMMYREADLMDLFPEVGAALDIYMEETTYAGVDNKMIRVTSKSERVKSILDDLIYNRLSCNTTFPMVTRSTVKYGNTYMLLNITHDNGVIGWKQLPVYEMERFENGMDNPYSSGFQTMSNLDIDKPDSTTFVWIGKNEFTPFRNWQIAHFRLLYDSIYLPYGCIVGDARIETEKGYKLMKDIIPGDKVWTFNINTQQKELGEVTIHKNKGIQTVYHIGTFHNEIEATADHKFLIYDKLTNELKYKEVCDLKIGDLLIVDNSNNKQNDKIKIDKSYPSSDIANYNKNMCWWNDNISLIPDYVDEKFARFFGFMLGDGWISNNGVHFAAGIHKSLNKEFIDYLHEITGRKCHFVKLTKHRQGLLTTMEYDQVTCNSKMLTIILQRMDLNGYCYEKRIPSWVYSLNDNLKKAFLSGLMVADGSYNIDKYNVLRCSLELSNEQLIKDTKILVQSLGYKSSKIQCRDRIGKHSTLQNGYKIKTKLKSYYFYYYETLNKQEKKYDLDNRLEQGFKTEKIRIIEEIGKKEVFDFTVNNNNSNFFANGIVTHNCSLLNKARRHWRMLSMMEDMMLMYRLERSVERRVFKVPVGAIDDMDVPAYMDDLANSFKRTPIIDPLTGQLDLRKNILSQSEDFFVPVRDPNDSSPIETLQAGQNLTAMDDIKFVQNKLCTALRVPKSFLNFEETTGDGKNLSMLDVRFTRTVNRVQQMMLMELNKICIIHLYLLGFEDELTNFQLSMNNPSSQAEMLELDNLSKKIELAKSAVADPGTGIPIMSITRAQKEILGWSDKQINDNLEELRLEKALAAELEQTTAIIKRTGLFSKVDNLYGEPGAEYGNNNGGGNQGEDAMGGAMGGGGDLGGFGMDMGSDMGSDTGDLDMEEGNGDIDGAEGTESMEDTANAESAPPLQEAFFNRLLEKTINERKKHEEDFFTKSKYYQQKIKDKLNESQKEYNEQLNCPLYKENFLINEELNSIAKNLEEKIKKDKNKLED